jgi:SAM-dependent methyltransferase
MTARHPDEITARAEAAVAALRAAAGPIARRLLATGPELLDQGSTPAATRLQILADAERLTRRMGVDRRWLRAIARRLRALAADAPGRPLRVLDVGCGPGGLLARIDDWGRRAGLALELHGVDVDRDGVARTRARAAAEGRAITVQVGDGRDLGAFADGSFDLALSTFTLHHLAPGDGARMLGAMARVGRALLVFDLRRSLLGLPGTWLLARLAGFAAPSRHDTVLSLRRGYTAAEVRALLDAAGVEGASARDLLGSYVAAAR